MNLQDRFYFFFRVICWGLLVSLPSSDIIRWIPCNRDRFSRSLHQLSESLSPRGNTKSVSAPGQPLDVPVAASAGGVELKFGNVLSTRVTAEHGVTDQEIEELVPQLVRIHQDLQSVRKEGQRGIMHALEQTMRSELERMITLASEWKESSEDIVILGGVSSGAEMVFTALVHEKWNKRTKEDRGGYPRIHLVNPDEIESVLNQLDLSQTKVVIIDSLQQDVFLESAYTRLKEEMEKKLGEDTRNHFAIVTAEKAPFSQEDAAHRFMIPAGLAIQDSFFTAGGILPLVLAGKFGEAKQLFEGAREVQAKIDSLDRELTSNKDRKSILSYSEYLHPLLVNILYQKKNKNIGIYYVFSEKLRFFANWRANRINYQMGRLDNDFIARGAVGPRHNHAELQNWQKGANHFQITTFSPMQFGSNLSAGPMAYPLFAGESMAELNHAARVGVEEALADGKRPNMNIMISKVEAKNLGILLYSTLYEDKVLEELIKQLSSTQERIRDASSFQAVIQKEVIPIPGGATHFSEDDSGIKLDYSLAVTHSNGNLNELESNLQRVIYEVATERLSNKHAFLNLPANMITRVQSHEFREVMTRLKNGKEKFIAIGIGGSSQGAKMELRNLGLPMDRIIFLEGTDPDYTQELLEGVDFTKAGVLAISKSGETMESDVNFSIVLEKMEEAFKEMGRDWNKADYIVAVTDPEFGLLIKQARRQGYGILEVPPGVGGRFSVLSDVGLSVLSLVMQEKDLLGFLEGARAYVERTELNLDRVKQYEALVQVKSKTAEQEEEQIDLWNQIQQEIQEKIHSIGYLYGGWSAFLNIEKEKDLALDIVLSSQLSEMVDEMVQLWNESLGKPGMSYYRRGIIGTRELLLNIPTLLNHSRQVTTLWHLTNTASPRQEALQRHVANALWALLEDSGIPAFRMEIPDTLHAQGALTVLKQQAVMVQAKAGNTEGYLPKNIEYSDQPGVELQKRYTRREVQRRKGSAIDVIPTSLAEIGSFVKSLSNPIRDMIAYSHFGSPKERQNSATNLIKKRIQQDADSLSVKNVWFLDENPKEINKDGTYSLVVVPIDQSAVVDMNNGTVGTLFALYRGEEYTLENLVATFVLLHGPTTVMLVRITTEDGEARTYDYIWDIKTGEFVQRQHAARETSLIEMGHRGDELAIQGQIKNWPKFLEAFYYEEIMRRGKKVRITESVADLYEMILKGGIIAAPLTAGEAVIWASMMESAGGRSLIMTKDGPQPILNLTLTPTDKSLSLGKRQWAFFGNKEEMERLAKYMDQAFGDMPIYSVTPWIEHQRDFNDGKTLKQTLLEMEEDPEAIAIVLNTARTVSQKILSMFSMMGMEEGGGEVNLAGDEQVGADVFTNVSFRNALLNPKNHSRLEAALIEASLSNKKVPEDQLRQALVTAYFSEEEDTGYPTGVKKKFFVITDPLDGSSKVDTNGGVSSIIGIWKADRDFSEPETRETQEGDDEAFIRYLKERTPRQALYGSFFFVYGPQTLLYYTSQKTDKVHLFRLNARGVFQRRGVLKPLPQGSPNVGLRLAIGGERPDMLPDRMHSLLTEFERRYSGRATYGGSLTLDFVGILNGNDPSADGGVYLYPGTKRRPEGRLRLDSELAPLSYVIEKIGGRASNGTRNILDIPIQKLHQHEPFFIGTKWVIDQIEELHGVHREEQDPSRLSFPVSPIHPQPKVSIGITIVERNL